MVGQIISHYRVISKLGEGGMGEVYLAEDISLKRKVALKFLPPHAVIDEEIKLRFINEARAAASLNHPNICTVYEIGEAEGKIFISMEYVEGTNLKDKIKASSLTTEERISITLKIAEGLNHASDKGVLHRDIKSSNIMITDKNEVKIMDFGLAKLKKTENITLPGTTLGTVAYMSPEQIKSESLDSRTDIWSLGVVLYEMLTGVLPFKGEIDQAVIYSILNDTPFADDDECNCPDTLKQIVLKMLRKRREERYSDFTVLIDIIKEFVKDEGFTNVTVPTYSSSVKRRKRSFYITRSFVVLALSMIVLYFVFRASENKPHDIKLVVLPFINLGNAEDEYFTEGAYDETISRLSHLKGLSVVPRLKAMQYDNTPESFSKMKGELNVDYIIDGTVKWTKTKGEELRIITNLIRTEDEELIWSEKFDGSSEDIFKIQTEIAELVAKHLDIEVLEPEREALRKNPTDNFEAYNAFLEGRKIVRDCQRLGRKSRESNYLKAVELFEKAIELDSTFFDAYVRLSHFNTFLYDYGYDATPERKDEARRALERLIEVVPDPSFARSQLAIFYYRVENDYQKAYEIYNEIRQEYPNYGALWLGIIETRLGLWDKAVKHLEEAVNKYPTGDDEPLILGHTYSFLRRYEEADIAYERSLNNHPNFIYAIVHKAFNHISWNGNVEGAKDEWAQLSDPLITETWWVHFLTFGRDFNQLIEFANNYPDGFVNNKEWYFIKYLELAKAYYLSDDAQLKTIYADSTITFLENLDLVNKYNDPLYHGALGLAHAFLGDKERAIKHGEMALRILPLSKDAVDGPTHHQNLAYIYSVLGMGEEAVEELKLLLSIPSSISLPYIKTDPLFDNIRETESYKSLFSSNL